MNYFVQIDGGEFIRFDSKEKAYEFVDYEEGVWRIVTDKEMIGEVRKILKALGLKCPDSFELLGNK